MNIVSQRDPRWKDIKLGTSTVTIGGYGCTITSLGYCVGITPDKVNERMLAVSGYSNGNLVLWGKVAEAIGVTCYRYATYDNAKVVEAISANGACLAEVDAAAIGGTGRHWIVLTGNQKCQDPWTGAERPTSDFTFTGFTTVVFDRSKLGVYEHQALAEDPKVTIARLQQDLTDSNFHKTNLQTQVNGLSADLDKYKANLKLSQDALVVCESKPPQIIEKEVEKEVVKEVVKEVFIPDPVRDQMKTIFSEAGWWWVKYAKIKALIG